jgi:hypothetical protein
MMRWCIISLFLKLGGMTLFLLLILNMRNEVVMNQLILFHKPKKKVRSEKMII